MATPLFLGLDLGWYEKPSGVAAFEWTGRELRLIANARPTGFAAVLDWVHQSVCDRDAVAAVDAPLVIRNLTGTRAAERELNSVYRKFHAGCHAANLGLPFAPGVTAFSGRLSHLGFRHLPDAPARSAGRYQIEVHPHAASIELFGLARIVKYKRGLRAERMHELSRLRRLIASTLPLLDPPASDLTMPSVPRTGDLKVAEDQIDAILCAYLAAHWWFWGEARNRVFGTPEYGAIVVPRPPSTVVG